MPITGALFYVNDALKKLFNAEKDSLLDKIGEYFLPSLFFINFAVLLLAGSLFFITSFANNLLVITPQQKFEYISLTLEELKKDDEYRFHFKELKSSSEDTFLTYHGAMDAKKVKDDIKTKMKMGGKYMILVEKSVPSSVPYIDTVHRIIDFDFLNDHKKYSPLIYGIKGHGINYDFRPMMKNNSDGGIYFFLFFGVIIFLAGYILLKGIIQTFQEETSQTT